MCSIFDIVPLQIYKLTIYNPFKPYDENIIYIKINDEDTEKYTTEEDIDDNILHLIISVDVLDENMMSEYYGLLYNNFDDDWRKNKYTKNTFYRKIILSRRCRDATNEKCARHNIKMKQTKYNIILQL
jgi:hypothetical protein